MKRNLIALFFALTVPTVYGATVLSSFLATDPVNGSLQILQVTGAVAGPTAGGLAVADTRTIFYWTPDLAKTLPVSPGYGGSNWPYVFVEGSFSVDASLDPAIFGTIAVVGTGGNLSGDVLTVNGFPVYTRTSHTGPG